MSIHFEAILGDQPNWILERLYTTEPATHAALVRCITLLEHNPFPPLDDLATLVIPHRRGYQPAFPCGDWRIAFHVEDHAFLLIDYIQRQWPPVDPSLRRRRDDP